MPQFTPASSPAYASLTPIQRLQNIMDYFGDPKNKYFDTLVFQHMRIVSASVTSPSVASCRLAFTIPPSYCQIQGSLHGGATATIFDVCTTAVLCLVNREGYWDYLGVSRTLNVTYLGAVKAGEEIEVESEIVGIGKRLVGLRGVMRRVKKGGEIGETVATCEHGKVDVGPKAKF